MNGHTGTHQPLVRVSIYVRQLYPHCPELLPKPMALMLKIMLDREFLPCEFADSPDFWEELASVFPTTEEQPAAGRTSARSDSFSGLEPAGAEVEAPEKQLNTLSLSSVQPPIPVQTQFSYRPPSLAMHQSQPPGPQYAPPLVQIPSQNLSTQHTTLPASAQQQMSFQSAPQQQLFQSSGQQQSNQPSVSFYGVHPTFQMPAEQQAFQASASTPNLLYANLRSPAQEPFLRTPLPQFMQASVPAHMQTSSPSQMQMLSQLQMQAQVTTQPQLHKLPAYTPNVQAQTQPLQAQTHLGPPHMQASIPEHMHASVLARMQVAFAAPAPVHNAPKPTTQMQASNPSNVQAYTPPHAQPYIPPHMQAGFQTASSAHVQAPPPGFSQPSYLPTAAPSHMQASAPANFETSVHTTPLAHLQRPYPTQPQLGSQTFAATALTQLAPPGFMQAEFQTSAAQSPVQASPPGFLQAASSPTPLPAHMQASTIGQAQALFCDTAIPAHMQASIPGKAQLQSSFPPLTQQQQPVQAQQQQQQQASVQAVPLQARPTLPAVEAVPPEDWSYGQDDEDVYIPTSHNEDDSSAGFTVVRSGGSEPVSKLGVYSYREKPTRLGKGYSVQDLPINVQKYIQKRLQPNHLELGHFDQQVLRRLKGLSETAALEVLYWVPTREKMTSHPIHNMSGFIMKNLVNMIKKCEQQQGL